jgi:hypothetical protein
LTEWICIQYSTVLRYMYFVGRNRQRTPAARWECSEFDPRYRTLLGLAKSSLRKAFLSEEMAPR